MRLISAGRKISHTRFQSEAAGFTLVELLIAMVLGLIVLGALISVFIVQNEHYAQQEQIVEIQEYARAGMQIMVSDLRMAGYDPTGEAGAGIVTAEDKKINFTFDFTGGESDGINNDGDAYTDEDDESIYPDESTDDSNEDITYEYFDTSDEIKRNGTVFIENVDSLTFSYFDASGTQLSDPVPVNAIRKISIQIETITKNRKTKKTLTSDVVPRNLGL